MSVRKGSIPALTCLLTASVLTLMEALPAPAMMDTTWKQTTAAVCFNGRTTLY